MRKQSNVTILPYGASAPDFAPLLSALAELGYSHVGLDTCESVVVILDADNEAVLPGLVPVLQEVLTRRPSMLLLVSINEAEGAHARAGATRGLRGLVRTLAQELNSTRIRLIEETGGDLTPTVAQRLVSELSFPDEPTICQYMGQRRYEIVLVNAPWSAAAQRGAGSAGFGESEREALGIRSDQVVVAVGGGRGITSQCLQLLVGDRCPKVWLVGSTPPPDELYLQEFDDCHDKRQIIAKLASSSFSSTPNGIERDAQRVMAQREILVSQKSLSEHGATVRYRQVDSTEEQSVRSFLRNVVDADGGVDILLYGAGITNDCRFEDVTCERIDQTMKIKVEGLLSYLSCLETFTHPPRLVVAFGSVAASAGNPGQSAYSIANDAMEGVLSEWKSSHHDSRVVTINWGPWEPHPVHPGMVTPSLGKVFARRGLDMLVPKEAARAFLTELAWGTSGVSSVTLVPEKWSAQYHSEHVSGGE